MPISSKDHIRRPITILADDTWLQGDLTVPSQPRGLVLFAHGSGSGRMSTRNSFVAKALNRANIATLLLDLLTSDEAAQDGDGRFHFDIPLLAARLGHATDAMPYVAAVKGLPIGYYGASTGAAAALIAATNPYREIKAIVSRGGRTDLAHGATSQVKAPTLLLVGGADETVLKLNRATLAELRCRKHLVVIPKATHLFVEPGALDQVSRLTRDWFIDAFASPSVATEAPNRPCIWPREESSPRS